MIKYAMIIKNTSITTAIMVENLKAIKQEIKQLSQLDAQVVSPINLIAVSKGFSAKNIELLYNNGQLAFGESYVNEFKQKLEQLSYLDNIEWHFIGTLQSNKLKFIANTAAWVHSLEKQQHAIKLNQLRQDKQTIGNKHKLLNVLIEVNISDELHKHGVKTLEAIMQLATTIMQQNHLHLRGVMGMASNTTDTANQMQQFKKLTNIFKHLKQHGFTQIDTISMGMSQDYATAIKCGATMLRIGSKIFGTSYNQLNDSAEG